MPRRLKFLSVRTIVLTFASLLVSIPIAPGASAATVTSVSAGMDHSCAITSAGGVRCWGSNDLGQLGNGTTVDSLAPVQVVGLASGVVSVSAGAMATCALTATHAVRCWGDGPLLGVGSDSDSSTPVEPSGLGSGVASISVGYSHACALMDDATVRCWGSNSQGSLGDGTRTRSLVPVTVPGLTGIEAVSAGAVHTCVLTTGGAVLCWGYNAYGQVGNGTSLPLPDAGVLSPVGVVGLGSGVAAIAAGGYHSCALLDDGTARCWGRNGSGQVGDGTLTNRLEPAPVSAPAGSIVSISPGEFHTCAITSAGGTSCWGDNVAGALATGDTTDRSVPTAVTGASSDTLALDGGRWDTCRVATSGRTSCWGWNLHGQLGNGSTAVEVTTPVSVAWFGPAFTANCSGLVCSFTDASTDPDGEIVSRAWSLGDGATASGTSAARTYAAPGTYTVALTATDAFGTSVTASKAVTVTAWNLRASVSKLRNVSNVTLTWNAAATAASTVDVLRNGVKLATAPNAGTFSHTATKGSSTYVVCPAGDARCSNAVTVKV